MATVKVAVRVRPLNQREENMECKTVIEMEGRKTRIYNPRITLSGYQGDAARERSKEFVFDYSYWSADSDSSHYVSQEQVFDDLGLKVIESAFEGYNACVFAYGQTSSGKTYTMMGSENEPGLIPRICQTLFQRMNKEKERGVTYRTEVSYLEIYNEKVKDLLKKNGKQQNLRLREHPKLGPYVQDLSKHLVTEFGDVEELMTQGNTIRTTASTKMNDTSSRSHAIFTLTFVQAKFDREMPIETVSKVHLVDLAGSERADATGATGERLKEGGHINKSLVTLGSVISALADISINSGNKSKQNFIPYRDSVLTWLLKDSLGGNSKTIMIATISPADCNYGETLSTLRYANRAKNIVNKPKVNEDPNVKLIRDLQEEIAKLRALLESSQNKTSPLMVEKLHENEARVKVLKEEWTERWRETQKILQEQKALGLRKAGMGIVLDSDMPHLIGIDDDILSTGVTLYHLKDGKTLIGSESEEKKPDIVLNAVGIENEHCIIELQSGTATLIPIKQAFCYVDGIPIDQPTKLSQGCVILLGHTNMFRYNDPAEAAKLRREKKGELSRSRLSFLSWSMPDLALSVDNGATPSAKLHLAGLAAENSKHLNQKSLEKRLQEAKEVMDLERKQLQDRWDKLFEREKNLLQSIDSSRYNSEDERKYLDKEQESIETEQQFLELEEERLDEKERRWQDMYQRIMESYIANEDFSKNGESRENSHLNGICESVLEESTENEKTTDISNNGESFETRHLQMVNEASEKEILGVEISEIKVKELKSNERIKEIFEQEVQKHIIKEMAERLQQIRSLRSDLLIDSRDFLSGCTAMFPSLGCSHSNSPEQLEPLLITIPSYIQRGVGFRAHFEYEIKIVVQREMWTIFRRYSKFRELHLRMARQFGPRVGDLYFPSRTLFGSKSDKIVKERQAHLELYLLQLIDMCFKLPECPLSLYTYETITKDVLCNTIPFLRKGLFEIGKSGTA